jgi:predicted acetyltransferase
MKRKVKEYRPRVVVKGNTGTRVMKSKKDKAYSRQTLKLALKEAY